MNATRLITLLALACLALIQLARADLGQTSPTDVVLESAGLSKDSVLANKIANAAIGNDANPEEDDLEQFHDALEQPDDDGMSDAEYFDAESADLPELSFDDDDDSFISSGINIEE